MMTESQGRSQIHIARESTVVRLIQGIYILSTVVVAIAYLGAAVNWFLDPQATGAMGGVPLDSRATMIFYGGVKGVQDLIPMTLLLVFLALRDHRGVLVGLGVALVIPVTDVLFGYQALGQWDSALLIHVIYVALVSVALAFALLRQWLTSQRP